MQNDQYFAYIYMCFNCIKSFPLFNKSKMADAKNYQSTLTFEQRFI